jgi:hypothetical protein
VFLVAGQLNFKLFLGFFFKFDFISKLPFKISLQFLMDLAFQKIDLRNISSNHVVVLLLKQLQIFSQFLVNDTFCAKILLKIIDFLVELIAGLLMVTYFFFEHSN